jgi:PAS domain S-box-containing protein
VESQAAQPDGGPIRASQLRASLRRIAPLAGAFAAAIGLATLVGWVLGIDPLVSIVPRWPPQVANAALLSTLGGAALFLGTALTSRPARLAATICAAAVSLLAGLTCLEHLAHPNLGIDLLLTPAQPAITNPFPGRPSLQTATTFLITSVALLSLNRAEGRAAAAAVWLPALLAGSLACVGLLGYALGVPGLYRVISGRLDLGMSIQTTMALLLLNGGVLLARPDVGPLAIITSGYAGGVTARRFLGGLVAVFPLALLVELGHRLGWYGEPVTHALLAFLGVAANVAIILVAAVRLDRDDVRRRQAEARAREGDQHFRELFEQANEGIVIAAIDGRYTDVNPAACQLLGYSRDELLGRRTAEFLAPEDLARLVRVREELLAGQPQLAEWRMRRRDGSYVAVEVSTKSPAGGRWHAFIREISDRKQREAELARAQEADRRIRREIEEVTEAALSVADTAAAMPAPDVTAVLQAFALQAQLLTRARWVAIGLGTDPDRPFDDWITVGEDDAARRLGNRPSPAEMAGVFGVPILYRGRRLGHVYLAGRAEDAALADRDQRLTEMLAARAAVAIEMVRLYSGAAAKRTWLLNIIDQMPEGVIVLNDRGGIEAMNRALLALSIDEAGATDASGNPATFEVHEIDGKRIPFADYLVVRALTRGEVAIDHELIVRVKDGRMVPVLVNAAPVRDESGRINGAVAVIRDISALRELERMREEWASVIAHDLRQPVGAIAIAAEALLRAKEGTSDRQQRVIERIRSASTRLGRMIDDLLDASRIEAKRLTVEPRLTDLGAVLEAAVEGHREATEGYPIRVAMPKGSGQWFAYLDTDRVHQVLGNLLSNAVKYGERGSEICVECRERGEELEVIVSNRGRGIPPEELPRLFSRFGRSRDAHSDRIPGLGLGLYIARGLIEAQGGRMWAESVPGASTSFHFTLPRSLPMAPESWDAPSP